MKSHKLRIIVIISFIFHFQNSFAQVSTFNQYNGALPGINPAYISGADKDHAGIIFRNQWPGYRLGSRMIQVDANVFIPRFSSGVGLMMNDQEYIQGGYSSRTYSFQYAYRVIMLDDYFLCLGAGLNYTDSKFDLNNFHYLFSPKTNYPILPSVDVNSIVLTGSFGLIFMKTDSDFYGGISIRDYGIKEFDVMPDAPSINKNPTISFQAMKRLALSRKEMFFLFASYEKTGAINGWQWTGEQVIQPSMSYLHFQVNYLHNRKYFIGLGYKAFFKNYGTINYRFSVMPGKKRLNAIGYSYDIKPFIQNDKIQSYSSHEIYYKRTF